MSDEAPPPERAPVSPPRPGVARTRLPFDSDGGVKAPFNGVRFAGYLYIVAALIMGGISAFMALGQGRALTEVPVFAPGLGALYFLVRAAMTLAPRTR